MRAALVQLNVTDLPEENLPVTLSLIDRAVAGGAEFVLTPEVTNCISTDRAHQRAVLRHEEDDPTLATLRTQAREHGIWLLIGSLSLKTGEVGDDRFANRSFLIAPDGGIRARYDKLHMFDVRVSDRESYRESAAFRPGDRAVVGMGPWPIGMTVCYDLRFAYLYRMLAHAGASVLTVPSAFTVPTGRAHWHVLLRARAIETGCFVVAPAQCGTHDGGRTTYGHSLIISPWGEILADGGEEPGVVTARLDLEEVAKARAQVPSLKHDRTIEPPEAVP